MKLEKRTILISSIVLVVLLLSFFFDFRISQLFSSMKAPWLYSFMMFFALYGTYIVVLVTSAIVFLKKRKDVLYMWASMALAWLLSAAIKIAVSRPRPFNAGIALPEALMEAKYSTWDLSFPSNHAVVAFAAIPFLPKKWRIPWIIISVFILLARIYFGLHYLSDIIAGAALGFIVAYFLKEKWLK